MFDIYLPIAGMPANLLVLLALGGAIGVLSGLLGVGGFLLTPLLLFIGIPAPVAVATTPAQLVGSALSGVIAHWRRGNVDFKLGAVLVVGSICGSSLGVWIFHIIRKLGQVQFVLSFLFLVILTSVGALMTVESFGALMRRRRGISDEARTRAPSWASALPLKLHFHRSNIYVSVFAPLGAAFTVGFIAALLGVGGGFMIVPAMIYLVGVPTTVVVGTSLLQVLFANGNATLLQSIMNHTMDIELAVVMVVSGVVGAQLGARWSAKVPAEHLRALLALMILAMGGRFAYELFATPAHFFTIATLHAH